MLLWISRTHHVIITTSKERGIMETILLAGVHGVGKGFFLEKVKENIKCYSVYSASNMIERYKLSADAGYKKVNNVNCNQDILINAIKKERISNTKNFIIDGHLCIFNADGDVQRIPEYFIINAKITAIVLLQDDPKLIYTRLTQRDSEKISIEDLQRMQDEELKYACELQDKFQIKYRIITHKYTGEQFEELLNNIGRGA